MFLHQSGSIQGPFGETDGDCTSLAANWLMRRVAISPFWPCPTTTTVLPNTYHRHRAQKQRPQQSINSLSFPLSLNLSLSLSLSLSLLSSQPQSSTYSINLWYTTSGAKISFCVNAYQIATTPNQRNVAKVAVKKGRSAPIQACGPAGGPSPAPGRRSFPWWALSAYSCTCGAAGATTERSADRSPIRVRVQLIGHL